jgi:hypothetical protein
MSVAVVSANLGNFERPPTHVEQSVPTDFYMFTDENFPPRDRAMTPRLASKIPKMFSWQLVPGYDHYIWLDASLSLQHPDSVKWWIEQCEGVDAAFLRHPDRGSVEEEYEFIKAAVEAKHKYLWVRYANEFLEEQMEEIRSDPTFKDDCLLCGGAFIYRNCDTAKAALKEWWYQTSRFHLEEQISLPFALHRVGCSIRIIDENFQKMEWVTYTRKKGFGNWQASKVLAAMQAKGEAE